MRKLTVATALGMLLATGSAAYADAVSTGSIIKLQLTGIDASSLDRFGGGGPFRADLYGTSNDFLTFCLEINEYFTPGENLKVQSITNEARSGGAGGATGGADLISGTTAYMYTQFRLGDIDFSSGALLQEAIWFMENEITSASQAALNLIGFAQTEMLALNWGTTYLGGVQVMNLYRGTDYSIRAQDMLTWDGRSTVPEPGTLALFALGTCLLMGGRYQRRVQRQSLGAKVDHPKDVDCAGDPRTRHRHQQRRGERERS